MKKAFGIFEILVVLVIIIIVYFSCFHAQYGRKDPFYDGNEIELKKELVTDKINEIEKTNELKNRIETNLNKGY